MKEAKKRSFGLKLNLEVIEVPMMTAFVSLPHVLCLYSEIKSSHTLLSSTYSDGMCMWECCYSEKISEEKCGGPEEL